MPFDLDNAEDVALRAPTYELALAEARDALHIQERAVTDLTSRAGSLIAAAALTTSIFGGQVLRDGHHAVAAWVAIGAFAGVAISVLGVLWPRHDWVFSSGAAVLIRDYAEPSHLPLALVHRDLALHRAACFAQNTRQLRRVLVLLRTGMCLLAVEVLAWLVAFAEVA